MAEEFPWLHEYISLIDWCRSRWGGKATRRFTDRYTGFSRKFNIGGVLAGMPSDVEEEAEIHNLHSLDSYPDYKTTIEEVPTTITLSDNNILYLSLDYRLKWEVLIRHEHWADSMFKKLRLEYEFQTGDDDFDKTYFLRGKDPSHRPIFMEMRFRNYIRTLEPFNEFATSAIGLAISRPIDNADLLKPQSIKKLITLLFEIMHNLKK